MRCLSARSAGLTGYYLDTIGNNKRRVKPHTKLPNELRVFFVIAAEIVQKSGRTRLCNGAEMLNDLVAAHANAVV